MLPIRRQRAISLLTGSAFVLALIVLLVFVTRDRLLAWVFDATGLGPARLSIRVAGLHHAELTDLVLGVGGAITAGSVTLDYAPGELVGRHVRRLAASGLRLSADLGSDGVTIGSFPKDSVSGGEGPVVDSIALDDAEIALMTPAGVVRVRLDGAVNIGMAGANGSFDIGLGGDTLRGAAKLEFLGDTMRLTVADTALTLPGLQLQRIAGSADASIPGGPRRWLDADLRAESIDLFERKFGQGKISIELGADTLGLHMTSAAVDGGHLEAQLDADGLRNTSPSAKLTGKLRWAGDVPEVSLNLRADRLASAAGRGSVAIAAELTSPGGHSGGLDLGRSRVAAHATLAWQGKQLSLALDEPATITLDRLRLAAADLDLPQGVQLQLAAGAGPLAKLDLATDAKSRGEWHAALTADKVAGDLPGMTFASGRANVQVVGAWPAAAAKNSLTASIEDLRLGQRWLLPLRLEASGEMSDGRSLHFAAQARDAAGKLSLATEGSADISAVTGNATLKLQPIHFAAGSLQPADLAPVLRGKIEQAEGSVALAGSLHWRGALLPQAELSLLLDQLSFTAGPVAIHQLNSVVDITRLWPIATQADQEVAIGLLDVGVPLSTALVRFSLPPDGTVRLQLADMQFAGGQVTARDIQTEPYEGKLAAVLDVDGVDLAEAFALAGFDGLEASGSLSGHIPLRIGPDGIAIAGGSLQTAAPGVIRYRPNPVPAALQGGGAGVDLMLQALQNFHYQAVRLTLDRELGGETALGVHVQGANPDLYGGYPVELNVNLKGQLDRMARDSLTGYHVPDQIRQRMLRFQERH